MPSSQYDDFLFAEVGEQENGMTMSMASALIRLGLDPWDEAARLATLPAATAVTAVAALIARMSDLKLDASEDASLAAALVRLLARGARPSFKPAPARVAVPWWQALLRTEPRWLVGAVAIAVIVAAVRMFFTH
jgi:hypothetical protein